MRDWSYLTPEYIKKTYNRRRKFLNFKNIKNDKFLQVWHSLKGRCLNKNHPAYHRYGGRGIGFLITVDEIIKLWIRDKAWLMKWPSLDRIDNNGHYTYENCQFIEMSENISKRRTDNKIKKPVINYLK